MPTTSTPHGPALATDAEIEAAVRAVIAEVTGVSSPPAAITWRYQRAVEAMAEEVTELLAALARQG